QCAHTVGQRIGGITGDRFWISFAWISTTTQTHHIASCVEGTGRVTSSGIVQWHIRNDISHQTGESAFFSNNILNVEAATDTAEIAVRATHVAGLTTSFKFAFTVCQVSVFKSYAATA